MSKLNLSKFEPLSFYKALADETRLKCILLIQNESELCVCELTQALNETQPKISRHLAQLKKSGLLSDRRQGQWVFYRVNPELPEWCCDVIHQTLESNPHFINEDLNRLNQMGDRPERKLTCC